MQGYVYLINANTINQLLAGKTDATVHSSISVGSYQDALANHGYIEEDFFLTDKEASAMEEDIVRQIRHDEIVAEMASERCHHFTQGGERRCELCRIEKIAHSLQEESAEVDRQMAEEFAANGKSPRWEELHNKWIQIDLDMGELGHP